MCFMVRFTRFPPQQRGLACIEFASREEQNIRCVPVDGPGVGAGDNPPGPFALSTDVRLSGEGSRRTCCVCACVRALMSIGVVVYGLGVVQVVRVAGWLGAPEMYTPTHTCTPRTHTYIHHLSGEDLSMVRLEPP